MGRGGHAPGHVPPRAAAIGSLALPPCRSRAPRPPLGRGGGGSRDAAGAGCGGGRGGGCCGGCCVPPAGGAPGARRCGAPSPVPPPGWSPGGLWCASSFTVGVRGRGSERLRGLPAASLAAGLKRGVRDTGQGVVEAPRALAEGHGERRRAVRPACLPPGRATGLRRAAGGEEPVAAAGVMGSLARSETRRGCAEAVEPGAGSSPSCCVTQHRCLFVYGKVPLWVLGAVPPCASRSPMWQGDWESRGILTWRCISGMSPQERKA